MTCPDGLQIRRNQYAVSISCAQTSCRFWAWKCNSKTIYSNAYNVDFEIRCRVLATFPRKPPKNSEKNRQINATVALICRFFPLLLWRSRGNVSGECCEHPACSFNFGRLKTLGPEAVGKGCQRGSNFGWSTAASVLHILQYAR